MQTAEELKAIEKAKWEEEKKAPRNPCWYVETASGPNRKQRLTEWAKLRREGRRKARAELRRLKRTKANNHL